MMTLENKQTISLGARVSDSNMFDETIGYEDEANVELADNLTPEEKQQALVLYRIFNELWGLCLVVGEPGAGKDLFGNYLSYTLHRYFPWKRILRDEKPRKLYGEYARLFNESVLAEDLARMRAVAKGVEISERGEALQQAADEWVTKEGIVLLKNSVLYLTEYWRYCYKRDPHNPMNKTMGGIHKEKRHLDCLILGTTQQVEDLDRFTCLPWVDWKVICTRASPKVNKTGFVFWVQRVKYDKRMGALLSIGRPFPIPVDAGKPRSYLGDGRIIVRKPKYTPENEEERVVLAVLNEGIVKYDELVDYIETYGDMNEREILATLKELAFIKRKRAVSYPCYFLIFNSKSAPQMRTALKSVEV